MIIKGSNNIQMSYYFDKTNQPNQLIQMGRLILLPGERYPKEGYAIHDQDEFSYIIKGSPKCVLEATGETHNGQPGNAQLILAKERHYNYNDTDEPVELVWMLVERSG